MGLKTVWEKLVIWWVPINQDHIYANSPGSGRSLLDTGQISMLPVQVTASPRYNENCSKNIFFNFLHLSWTRFGTFREKFWNICYDFVFESDKLDLKLVLTFNRVLESSMTVTISLQIHNYLIPSRHYGINGSCDSISCTHSNRIHASHILLATLKD